MSSVLIGFLVMVGVWGIAVGLHIYLTKRRETRRLADDALRRLVGDEMPPIPMNQFELPTNNDWVLEREEPE